MRDNRQNGAGGVASWWWWFMSSATLTYAVLSEFLHYSQA